MNMQQHTSILSRVCGLAGVWLCILCLTFVAPLMAAEPQTLTLKDWTGRGFAPDLVNYTIPARSRRPWRRCPPPKRATRSFSQIDSWR